MKTMSLKITTCSNLMIGGTPTSFEIGGVDLYTVVDYEKRPFIPASSLKGSLRRIVKDLADANDAAAEEIKKCYGNYLKDLQTQNEALLQGKMKDKIDAGRAEALRNRFGKAIQEASALYLFGIQGFANTPRLIFNDMVLAEEGIENVFSIDSKNAIYYSENSIEANPRMYKAVRPGVAFVGEIGLYRIEELRTDCVRGFMEKAVLEYNSGIYRLGNSGSRGYGRVNVAVFSENECWEKAYDKL